MRRCIKTPDLLQTEVHLNEQVFAIKRFAFWIHPGMQNYCLSFAYASAFAARIRYCRGLSHSQPLFRSTFFMTVDFQSSSVYFISGKFPSFFFFFLFYFPLPPENFLGFSEETKGTKHSLKTSKHILNKFGNKANYCFICEQQTSINNCGLQAYIKIAAAFLRTYLKARNCWKGTVIILLN